MYLGLGSNVGDRESNLREALERLEAEQIRVLRRSSLYETEPQDLRDQPWFLNAVVEAETDLFPRQLLGCIQNIEREMGRQRGTPKGPRNIDIDILFYGRSVIAYGGTRNTASRASRSAALSWSLSRKLLQSFGIR